MSWSDTEVITAVDSGETTNPMPMPNSALSGSSTNQVLCSGIVSPTDAKAMATHSEPAAIIGPGPNLSVSPPDIGDSTVIASPSGSSISETTAADSPHPAMTVIGM